MDSMPGSIKRGHRTAAIAVVIALCVMLYIYSYNRIPPVTEIIQTSVSAFKPRLLFEKQPIVIEEPIVDPMALVPTLFKFLAWGTPRQLKNERGVGLQQAKSRYTIIACTGDAGGQVDAFHPKYSSVLNTSSAQFITFNLSAHQVMILPRHWWFQVKGRCHIIALSGI